MLLSRVVISLTYFTTCKESYKTLFLMYFLVGPLQHIITCCNGPAINTQCGTTYLRLNLYDEPVMGRTYYFEWVRHLAHRIKQLELISTCL